MSAGGYALAVSYKKGGYLYYAGRTKREMYE
jgi:hypothetical protein